MTIRMVREEDFEQWLAMRVELWPETAENQHRLEMAMMTSDQGKYAVFVCEDRRGRLAGFTEVSLREYAEGCDSSPVGYLEGWYVVRDSRGQGVGKALEEASEDWARFFGCTEMASDTDLGNDISEYAHLRLGFEVAARLVAFRKDLIIS